MQPSTPAAGLTVHSPDSNFSCSKVTLDPAKDFPLCLVQPGDLVFDIGANLGAKAERFLAAGARVVCVEPQPECAAHLYRKFAGNPNIAIEEKGLADKVGTRHLSICSAANTISTFSEEWKHGRFADYKWDRVITVEVTTLDDLIQKHGVPRYCKIDVEGFELSVLEGLSRAVPCVSFEFTIEFLANARRCVEHLERLGFIRFNVCLGENTHREFPLGLDARQLLTQIATLNMSDLWGDIYAEADCVPTASKSTRDVLGELLQSGIWRAGTPLRLHLGCGEQRFSDYVNIDYPPTEHNIMRVKADFLADITRLDFPHNSVDEVRLHHVFEHFNRVTALAMLIRWHGWLKVGGQLRIETPDVLGGARTLVSNAPFKVKMGVVRHMAGDQAASWAYHVDHWWPERYEHTLKRLGFEILEIRTSSWPHEPYLSNVEVIAMKGVDIPSDRQLTEADNLLWESTVDPIEKPTWEVWCQQLRAALTNQKA